MSYLTYLLSGEQVAAMVVGRGKNSAHEHGSPARNGILASTVARRGKSLPSTFAADAFPREGLPRIESERSKQDVALVLLSG